MSKSKALTLTAWLICGIGAIFYSYEYLLRISPSVMEPALRTHFNLTATGFGLLSSAYYYAYVPMQLPVGVLMDRYGPKRLLTFACMCCVFGTFIFCHTHDYHVAIIGRFFVGLGSAFAFVGVLKLATIWLPEDRLAMVAGLTSALGTVGAMIGDNLMTGFVNAVGWQMTDTYTAIFGLLLAVLLWFGIHDHKNDLKSGGTIDSFKQNLLDLNIIIRDRQIWLNGMFGCLIYLPTTVFAELWGIPYLMHAHGMTESQAGFANSILFFGFMIGAPLMGYISDHMQCRRKPMIVGACGAAVMMTLILYYPNLHHHTIHIFMFILGLFYSAQAIVFAVGRELSPKEAAGTAIAATNMFVMLGAMLLQPLIGKILDWSVWLHHSTGMTLKNIHVYALTQYSANDYRFALSLIPIGIVIAAILTLFIRETHAQAHD
ncbi:MAG: MFS transporter [Gammaproteobacteria bacterium]|nr:MFS transporter [Gammaproteobacteria bacterium]